MDKEEIERHIRESPASMESVCKLVMKLEIEIKQRLNELISRIEILEARCPAKDD